MKRERSANAAHMNTVSSLSVRNDSFRRVNRELLIYLAGGRALLLELAHPFVAAGVAQHSDFRRRPLRRLWRTLRVMLQLTFGKEEAQRHALQMFQRCHRHVHGCLPEREGRHEAGTFYHAADPDLKMWVLATLIDSALAAYEMFVAPLSWAEKQFYYEDCKPVAQWLGVTAPQWPENYAAFTRYMNEMLEGETLHVGENARGIVAAVLRPLWLRPIARLALFFGTGLLPERVRAGYQLHWSVSEQERLQRFAMRLRRLRARLPDRVCILPQAFKA